MLEEEMNTNDLLDLDEIGRVIRAAKKVAIQYRMLTGCPLGITGEVAEYGAARLLNLQLSAARQAGYDAIRRSGNRNERLQIKGRCIISSNPGQRVGKIDLTKEWESVILVLLDRDLEPTVIYEAERPEVTAALTKPGSKARVERGQMSVTKFKAIAKVVWSHTA
jgi:hypothetical protein